MSCDLFTPDDGRCGWCRQPVEEHRFVPCPRCGGWTFLPDPTDRSGMPLWARRKVRCSCVSEDHAGGWLVRETGEVASTEALREVGWRRPRFDESTRRYEDVRSPA